MSSLTPADRTILSALLSAPSKRLTRQELEASVQVEYLDSRLSSLVSRGLVSHTATTGTQPSRFFPTKDGLHAMDLDQEQRERESQADARMESLVAELAQMNEQLKRETQARHRGDIITGAIAVIAALLPEFVRWLLGFIRP